MGDTRKAFKQGFLDMSEYQPTGKADCHSARYVRQCTNVYRGAEDDAYLVRALNSNSKRLTPVQYSHCR